uniref:Uncharacterized protein n=1 Tax=Cannabis sativa TaxID=3483 RepID=A0A803NP66_CANSA
MNFVKQIAYEYGRRGACLTLVDIKDNLEEVKRKAHKLGSPDVISIVADVTKVEDCKRFIDETVQHFGQLDHLVNNAGTVILSKFEKISGSLITNQLCEQHSLWNSTLEKKQREDSSDFLNMWKASKAALISFCETLRIEVGSTIGITVITPGLIGTKMTRELQTPRLTAQIHQPTDPDLDPHPKPEP